MTSNRLTPALRRLKPPLILLTAVLGAFLFVYLFGPATYDLDGIRLNLSINPTDQGKTTLDLSPFGNVSAATHNLPLEFTIKLDYIGTELARNMLITSSESPDEFINDLKLSIPSLLKPFIVRQLLLAALGAALSVWLLWRSKWLVSVGSGVLGSLIVLFILAMGLQNYNLDAFREPEYNGVLAIAPTIIPEPDKLLERLDLIQHQTRTAASNIQTIFTNLNNLSVLANPEEDNQIKKILLVSDLHSNPIGIEFLKSLASNFNVDIIVDCGDLTDFGNPLETKMTEGLLQIDIPYVFVPGNHDTPEIIDFVKEMKNSTILEGNTVTIKGIKIKGNADPLSTSNEVSVEDRTEWETMINKQVEDLLAREDAEEEQPDIVVVHNHEVAQKLSKHYPLVIYGHTHQQSIVSTLDNIRINPGTSGAAGIRGLYADKSIPYSAVILYIKSGEKPVAADQIKYDPLADRFNLERKLFKSET
ncbi:MAG: hypothetical protein GX790_08055 [Syntrophomonadaceae bacterium]|nr:hypothetical protein [Syntrophomonadaceae bacterium]